MACNSHAVSRPFEPAWLAAYSLLLIAVAGCDQLTAIASIEDTPAEIRPIPVTATPVRQYDPAVPMPAPGTVQAWKKQDVGFQVGGRLIETIELGEEVAGGNWHTDKSVVGKTGSMLARLDDHRYRTRMNSAQAQKEAAELRRAAILIEAEDVLAAQLASAVAEYELASSEVQRLSKLVDSNVVTRSEYENVEANLKTAKARVRQIQASVESKKAELKSMTAQIKESEAALEQAKTDLEDCNLFAPFQGVVSEVHVIEGGFVAAGQPVVTLTMMDPLLIHVSVSAKTDREIYYGDQLKVTVPDLGIDRWGTVIQKDTEADPSTRTFNVVVLVRNSKIQIPQRPDLDLPRIKEFRLLRTPEADTKGPLFVERDSLYQDAAGHFVWRLIDASREDAASGDSSIRQLERVNVRLGEDRVSLPGQFEYFELADTGDLTADHVLVCGVPDGFQSGESVLIVRERWLFRPGELVEVELPAPGPGFGFYVPMQSIIKNGSEHVVFVVDEKEGNSRAVRIPVRIQGELGRLRQIEAVGEKALGDGTLIVLSGAAYVNDGEALRVIGTEEVSP